MYEFECSFSVVITFICTAYTVGNCCLLARSVIVLVILFITYLFIVLYSLGAVLIAIAMRQEM